MLDNFVLSSLIFLAQIPSQEQQFMVLKKQLELYGFQVLIELPPQQGAYGLLRPDAKKIWINPVVFDLQIAVPTLIHEGTHAAQVCAGKGKITLLNLDLEPINYARPFFNRYQDIHRKDLEREAYTVQTQPNAFELVLSLLKKHCK
ncbi:hypothetical protein [Aphanothece sacrum]|uniref:Uncharacterized protein n=1 Tax=Aphanothece sacrum FPU1 TaxID=1920663 RepID=A0A401IJM3_APHSA|nr:hypothetical protein [Aphanothece sacrum]GBF81459.1 hypothetical protein AsFPU1_2873 [Aphanothece sacrum FPU1]GBF85590.1 hypothetical protein AsFPU3_2653 [Aphanothece sacrum FPU3]